MWKERNVTFPFTNLYSQYNNNKNIIIKCIRCWKSLALAYYSMYNMIANFEID